jgi:predicted phage tail protein
MTGISERPSRNIPENRKAQTADTKSARTALRNLHAAERALSRASQQAEVAKALAIIAARSAQATSAKAQAITGHYADKIAALSKHLTQQERAAAIQQIKLEEAAALTSMYLEAMREDEQQRQSVTGPINARHRSTARTLSRRQRTDSLALSAALESPRLQSINRAPARTAVRHIARRIFTSRSS